MKQPNFFIVGAPKAGTTSLYAYLDQHPQVYMCPLKEPNFFADEIRPENFSAAERPRIAREMLALRHYLDSGSTEKRFGGLVTSWDDYLRLYRSATDELAIGEASACYLWSQTAPANIAARIPGARIIINLRSPIDRAYSQYLQMVTTGVTGRSFRQQIEANLRCRERQFGADWPMLEFGLYHDQVERYLQRFPRSQVHISLYEDLVRAPEGFLRDLFAFLQVDPAFSADLSSRHHVPRVPRMARGVNFLKQWHLWPQLRRLAPHSLRPWLRSVLLRPRASLRIDPQTHAFLADYYRDDINRLAALLNRDLGEWLATGPAQTRI